MSSSATIKSPETLTETRKAALINLLTDEDPGVYQVVRVKILSCGPAAVEWLRPHALSSEPVLRRRSQEIIHHLERQRADDRFLEFCLKQGEDLNLEQGVWLLSQTQYPEINVEAYNALFDSYAGELRERLDLHADADELLGGFNSFLFDVLGFKGNEQNHFDPENSYLNRVMDRRKGNAISLCLVYLLLARRLRMPVSGIGLPGYFICRYQSASEEYYIDVFNGGKLWTKAHCNQFLLERQCDLRDDYLTPITPRRMLMRICGNLHQCYRDLEITEETTRFQRYLVALAR